MANEPGGIVFAQPVGTIPAGVLFPKEFKQGLFGRFDRRFGLLVLICMIATFTAVGLLSLRKPSETVSDKEIMKIQERYARLVLNQPKPAVEPKVAEVTEQITDAKRQIKKEEEKKEEVKVDREKETFVEKKIRKQSGVEVRRQVREQAARQIQTAGIFAAITASGSGGSGGMSSTSDLLGTSGLGVTDLGELSLTKGTFTAKSVDPAELIARKDSRTTNVNIEREEVGRTVVTRVAANVEVNVTTAPPEVTGESASLQERSQSAIQNVVSRESRRLKRLYEEWLKRDPTLGGRLTVKFVILPSGAVANVVVVKSTTGNGEFDEMVLRYIKRWQFSAIEGAGPVEVVYPFVFEGQS
ncbi:MAG: TonB family protein [Chitinispirillaceae bacterium]|nr:TonB family protein [Chitinispirillaceae bacterium]